MKAYKHGFISGILYALIMFGTGTSQAGIYLSFLSIFILCAGFTFFAFRFTRQFQIFDDWVGFVAVLIPYFLLHYYLFLVPLD